MIKPKIISLKKDGLEELKKELAPLRVVDTYREQLEDLFLIRNPRFRFNKEYKKELSEFEKEHCENRPMEEAGKWVYFPWNLTLVHYLNDEEHQEVRTARNKNFILPEEQKRFYNFSVGIAGLSVGSHGATTVALMGGSRRIKLADPDTISPTNLNRMRFDFLEIGENKAEAIARYIYQLNPYAEIEIFKEGITNDNMEEFLGGLDLLVEELDDIEMKVKMRELAKEKKLPVIMATDNGDSVIMDIERFDKEPGLPVFHGNLEGFDINEVKKSPQKMFEAMARIIDVSLVPVRIMNSVREVGRTIYSWPQLASAATLSGVVLAYVIRKIALGEDIKDGKLEFDLEAVFNPSYKENRRVMKEKAEEFLKSLK